jgi:DNA-binding response OmpR family regulator
VTERVLVVEADVVLGGVIAEVLRHQGYEVTFVRTLLGGVERIDSVSAVILDIDTNPAERELMWLSLLEPLYESLPIVLMGVQVPEDLAQGLRSHAVRLESKNVVWVQKPFRNQELLAAVRQAQEGLSLRTGKWNMNRRRYG